MSDEASAQNQVGRNFIEEYWWKGFILLQIWQEVLRVTFAGELGRLDEFKREMWLLLVAAGSGYLARCWHKTLKPKPQLTDYPHVDPKEREKVVSSSPPQLLEDASPNAIRRNSPASLGNDLGSKPLKRNFSPKALSKKLFSDGKSGKTPKKESESSGPADQSNRLITAGVDASLDSPGVPSKKSPWSSFKSKTKENPTEESAREFPGVLKRTGDAFRKTRDRRKLSDSASSSSRSLQSLLGDGGDISPSVGSSRRELDAVGSSRREVDADNLSGSSNELPVRHMSGLSVTRPDDPNEALGLRKLGEVEGEAKTNVSNSSEISRRRDAQGSANGLGNKYEGSPISRDVPSSVAEVVARLEKGNLSLKAETVNAVLSLRAANQAQAHVSLTDRDKVRNLQLENVEKRSLDEEFLTGGKGKRRADVGKVADGEGTVLPVLLTGKRTKDSTDSNKSMSHEADEAPPRGVVGKRVKDVINRKGDTGDPEEPFTASAFGDVDLSQVFYGFDSNFFMSPGEEKSPFKFSRRSRNMSRSGNRSTVRKMRESPKPVSALESCLRAQLPFKEEGSRVARSLNFSSLVGRGDQHRESLEPVGDTAFLKSDSFSESSGRRGLGGSEPQSPQAGGVLGLPLLRTPPSRGCIQRENGQIYHRGQQLADTTSNYPRRIVLEDRGRIVSGQSKLHDVLWRKTTLPVPQKKRRVSQACSPSGVSSNLKPKGYELEGLVIPPMEGLLFSFGVGIGVMSLMNEPDSEIERLSKELWISEEKVERLSNLLKEAKEASSTQGVLPSSSIMGVGEELRINSEPSSGPLALGPPVDAMGYDIYRREAPETPQQIEQMAELEAELEAELDALTSGISEENSGPPDFQELDPEGVAGVADRDLGVDGLPAVLDWDDDNDDFITEETTNSGGGVPPRELARLLRKLQTSRQEHRISELEADLQEAVDKMHVMEKEMNLLKEQISGVTLPSSDSVTDYVPNNLPSGDNTSLEIDQPNHAVFELLGGYQDRGDSGLHESDVVAEVVNYKRKSSDEPGPSISVISQLDSSTVSLISKGLVASLMMSEESMESEAQADNDAVCDEFLNSVFGSPDDPQIDGESLTISPASVVEIPSSPRQDVISVELEKVSSIPNDLKDGFQFTPSGEDLDQVVGELLKRDSSSVKNAINAFLLWEAETEDGKDDMGDEEAGKSYSRRTAGKNPTPQKTSIISARLEQLARSAFTSEKLPILTSEKLPILTSEKLPILTSEKLPIDKTVGAPKLQGMNVDDKPTKPADKSLDVPQPHFPKVEDRSVKHLGLREQPLPRKERGSVMSKRETVKGEASVISKRETAKGEASVMSKRETAKGEASVMSKRETVKGESSVVDNPRDLFRSESPVFGGVDKDYQALFDTRRELRYSSTKIQLSLSGPSQERDNVPVYRHREDASRAGTNSPIGRLSVKNLFQSPKPRNTRMSLENRLYQNPTSDWLAEVGSPPDPS